MTEEQGKRCQEVSLAYWDEYWDMGFTWEIRFVGTSQHERRVRREIERVMAPAIEAGVSTEILLDIVKVFNRRTRRLLGAVKRKRRRVRSEF